MSRNYKEFVESMTITEHIDWVENHFAKYRKLGYSVGHYISLSDVSDVDGNTIVNNRNFYHELKTIDEMEEYLKNK